MIFQSKYLPVFVNISSEISMSKIFQFHENVNVSIPDNLQNHLHCGSVCEFVLLDHFIYRYSDLVSFRKFVLLNVLAPLTLQDWQKQVAGNHIKPLWSPRTSLCFYDLIDDLSLCLIFLVLG